MSKCTQHQNDRYLACSVVSAGNSVEFDRAGPISKNSRLTQKFSGRKKTMRHKSMIFLAFTKNMVKTSAAFYPTFAPS